MPVTVRMPAKINIALQVGPAREDGFHELQTIYHAVSLYDAVTVADAPVGAGITITCTNEDVPLDTPRLWLALFALVMFVLCFTPAPVELLDAFRG